MRLPDGERSRVVLIGTSSHHADAELPDLPSVHNNLIDLAAALSEPLHGWISPDTCALIDNPRTPQELASRLAVLTQEAEDLLLIYFAGHGLLDDRGSLHLALADTERGAMLPFTAMPYRGVRELVVNSPARNRVVILDCCFSGRALNLMAPADHLVKGQTAISGSYILTATAADKAALAPDGERNTAFTGELLRVLKEGDPEASAELLTLDDVYRFLLQSLRGRGLPKPRRQTGDTAGDLAIARNVGYRPPSIRGSAGQDSSRLLLDEEERVGHGGDPLEAARRYADIAAILVRVYGAEFADVQAAEASRVYWAEYAATAAPARTTITHKGLGIDLGRTSAVIAAMGDTYIEPAVITNSEGSETTPSVIAWSDESKIFVGAWAARQAITNIERTVRFPARRLSGGWSTPIRGHSYTSAEVTAHILRKLKRDAEEYLDAAVQDVVITVPALLDENGRRTVEKAAEMAGLTVTCLLAAPTAAALAYGAAPPAGALGYALESDDETILVFDLGGGTFDVCLAEVGDGVVEIKAVNGDDQLGGDDWDQRIVDNLVRQFQSRHDVDLSLDKMALQRLREAAENAKIELSSSTETSISLPYITASPQGPLHLDEKLTRGQFEQLTADLLERCKTPVFNVMKDAGVSINEIDRVVLVGGSTRMPAVAELVERVTGGKVLRKMKRVPLHPEMAPALGAALRAGITKGQVKDVLLLDVVPLSLGIETEGGIMTKIIERNTTIPTKRSAIFTTIEDNQSSAHIPFYQGERELAASNSQLGMLELAGLPPAPRGLPQIEVTFEIDYAGRIRVTAKDLGTGRMQEVAVNRSDPDWRPSRRRDASRLLASPSTPEREAGDPPAFSSPIYSSPDSLPD